MENGMLEHRYRNLRSHLDDLGYRQPLVVESLALVEKLLSDLLHTTESLRHYKELAQKSLEECSNLELGAGPYKLDNARLVKECNELHLKLLQQEEDADKTQKDLKIQVRRLESEKSDLQFLSSQHIAQIKALEQESAQKSRKVLQLQGKYAHTIISGPGGKKKTFSTKPQATFELDSPLKLGKSWQEQYSRVPSEAKKPYIADVMQLADQRIANLNRELNILKEENGRQSEIIATLKNKLNAREREIQRLMDMLEGGRSLAAIRKDCTCTCKDKLHQLNSLAKEVRMLELKNEDLEQKVKDSVASQQEAEEKAAWLEKRNKHLEKELHDVDQMALAVEDEYSSSVKQNSARAQRFQERMKNNLKQVLDLEREVLELKRNNQELQASMEGLRNDKHHLQRKLETALDEKKRNSDRVNELTIIEHGLNKDIERLIQETTLQKRKIAELESQLASTVTHPDTAPGKTQKKIDPGKRPKIKSPTRALKYQKGVTVPKRTSPEYHVKLNSEHYEALIKKLESERDFYYSECRRLKEEKRVTSPSDNSSELRRKLNEKEQQLLELQQTNRELVKEKGILRSCIDAMPKRETHSTMTSPPYVSAATDAATTTSLKAVIKHLEQERDVARGDMEHLEEERDALRERLKISTETQVAEHARLETVVTEYEERIRKLEAERRELLASQGSRKATVSNLESQAESLQSQLIIARSELTEQRALYNQIKTLQEQTDQTLADSQGQLHQSEMELRNCQERVRQLEKDRAKLDQEVARYKDEISVMRGTLAQVDQEKDGLLISIDNKTEKAAVLEQELKATEDRLRKTEEALTEARKRLSIALGDIASSDTKARSSEHDAESLRHELEMLKQARESALAENRLLHSDLAKLTEDCRRANSDLECSRQEVENLKLQLQGYVSEVRRVEELLARKEGERSEMLDHYHSLSMEASALENNNHSLETEIQDARAQLRAANDRITDLEQLLESKDTLVNNYERQIADLSGSVARLEMQMRDELNRRRRAEEDVGVVRDLCAKLDTQKDTLMQQVTESDHIKMQNKLWKDHTSTSSLEAELARLHDEQIVLQEKLTKDGESIETLEKLLSSCRKDTLDQKLANQDMLAEVSVLREKITALQEKLDKGSSELHRSQQQALELSQQVSKLQSCVTNEQFKRVRMEEECRRLNQLLKDHDQTTRTIHTSSPPNQSRQTNLTKSPLHKDMETSCPVSTGEASYATSVDQPVSSPHTSTYVPSRVPKQSVANGQRDEFRLPRFAQFAAKPRTSHRFRPAERNISGLNTTQRTSHTNSSAFFAATQPSDPCVPSHQQKTFTSPGTQPPFSPTVIVKNLPGKQTIQVTFASTGPPISRFCAKYNIVRQGGVTKTTDSTNIRMSTRDSTGPTEGIKSSESHRDSVSGQDELGVQACT